MQDLRNSVPYLDEKRDKNLSQLMGETLRANRLESRVKELEEQVSKLKLANEKLTLKISKLEGRSN